VSIASPALIMLALASAAHQPRPIVAVNRLAGAPAAKILNADPRPLDAVAVANRRALQEPDSLDFVNAAQVYPWGEGAIYRLFTAPGLVSDIALQPGENLVSVAAGDTVRWVIGDTTSGAGSAKRTHILVKPIGAPLHTNVIIATDRRTYLLALQSTFRAGMAAISWSYPQDDLLALRKAQDAALAATPIAEGVVVEQLNFNYRIEGDRAAWTPLCAFDDGTRTFIEFPPTISTGEIPPLFVIGSSGKAELVNYRQSGRYYIVDRLFSIAELRFGEKRQLVVRIVRTRFARWGRGS